MWIAKSQRIAGQPALVMRQFMRSFGEQAKDLAFVMEKLQLSRRRAQRLFETLCRLGYLAPHTEPDLPLGWRRTTQGAALALASAAPPLRRATAERKLQEFLIRVAEVNRNGYFLFRVTKVVVFGSYLSKRDRLNDVDVAIGLAPKERNPERHFQLERARTAEALHGGRRFSNVVDELAWPQREVELFLKGRSRALSVHDFRDAILERTEFRVVFEEGEAG